MKFVLKFIIFSWLYFSAPAINIDDKLDFEDSSRHSNVRSHTIKQTSNTVPLKYTKTTSTINDDLDTIGVVCVSGGCNKTTASTSGNSQDSVHADIVVHVETKVNLNKDENKSEDILEDTPDIPVVVGYRGSQLDSTPEDGTSGLSTPQSIYVPSNTGSIASGRRNYYNQPIGYKGSSDSLYSRSNSYNPPVFTPIGSKIYPTGINTIDNYSPAYYAEGLTGPSTSRQIKVLSPIAVGFADTNTNDIKYKMNGTIALPYFDPSYHSHYYGENPPPQYSWYPKINNNIQGVDSRVDNPAWSSNTWHRMGGTQPHVSTATQGMKCVCQNGQTGQLEPTTGLRWYPSVQRALTDDPGSQINDKLAPLN